MVSCIGLVSAANCGGGTVCNCGDSVTSDYVMTANLTGCNSGSGLLITTSGITLDCDNYFIQGTASSTYYGINIAATNVKVIDCYVKDMARGMSISKANGTTITNFAAKNASSGIIYLQTVATTGLTFTGMNFPSADQGWNWTNGRIPDVNIRADNVNYVNNFFNITDLILGRATILYNTGGASSWWNISNNVWETSRTTASTDIYPRLISHSIFSNNTIHAYGNGIVTGVAQGILKLAFSSNWSIYNNNFYTDAGITNRGTAIYTISNTGADIHDNIFQGDFNGTISADGNAATRTNIINIFNNSFVNNYEVFHFDIDYAIANSDCVRNATITENNVTSRDYIFNIYATCPFVNYTSFAYKNNFNTTGNLIKYTGNTYWNFCNSNIGNFWRGIGYNTTDAIALDPDFNGQIALVNISSSGLNDSCAYVSKSGWTTPSDVTTQYTINTTGTYNTLMVNVTLNDNCYPILEWNGGANVTMNWVSDTNYNYNKTGIAVGMNNYSIYCVNANGASRLNAYYTRDTCTYDGSGNWNVNCADNCILNSNTDIGGNNLTISGAGNFVLRANVTNSLFEFIWGISAVNRCSVFCIGGCLQ